MMRSGSILSVFLAGILAAPVFGKEPTLIPDPVQDILMQNCLKCHDADSKKAISISTTIHRLERQEELYIGRALHAIEQGLMPPQDQKQPSREDRRWFGFS